MKIDDRFLLPLLKLDYPDLKVIYMSSSIDAEIRARTRPSIVVMLENPFRPDRLRQAGMLRLAALPTPLESHELHVVPSVPS